MATNGGPRHLRRRFNDCRRWGRSIGWRCGLGRHCPRPCDDGSRSCRSAAVSPALEVRSLGVLGDRLYLGATDGRLYRYSVPPPDDAALPLIGLPCMLLARRRCALEPSTADETSAPPAQSAGTPHTTPP